MKNKVKLFKPVNRVYFHHQYGTHEFKNRKRQTAIATSGLLIVSGCFLFISTFLLPYISNIKYSSDLRQTALAQQNPATDNNKKIEPINRNDTDLEKIITQSLGEFPSDQKWSVYVYDLKTDKTAKINADQPQDAASLYKLFLVEYLEQKINYQDWNSTWLVKQNVADCVDSMLKQEDNPCSEELADKLDLKKVDEFNAKNGYKDTKLSENYGKQTSASDIGKLFVSLKKGQTLGDSARRFVFDALYQQQLNNGISKGCGDCRTANKQGELSNLSYDAGVVTHGAHSYVLVAMSHGGSFEQITKLTKTIDSYLK